MRECMSAIFLLLNLILTDQNHICTSNHLSQVCIKEPTPEHNQNWVYKVQQELQGISVANIALGNKGLKSPNLNGA